MINIFNSYDPVGRVKELKHFYIRKINKDFEQETLNIINSGALNALIERGIFPKTFIRKKHKNLFLYHDKLNFHSVRSEWTFSMIKDATLVMLEADIILREFGYTLKDFHFCNICFSQTTPVFIDFGSIVKNQNLPISNTYFMEFIKSAFVPLYAIKKGDLYFAKHYLSDDRPNKFFGISPCIKLPLYLKAYFFLSRIQNYINRKLNTQIRIIKNNPRFNKYIIDNLHKNKVKSLWGDYQKNLFSGSTPQSRFGALIEEIKQINPETILDIAGNAGFFAIQCINSIPKIKNIYSCDCDYTAIENLYSFLKNNSQYKKITPIHMNIIFPSNVVNDNIKRRLKSDVVCALALTHHIFLTQNIKPDYFFSELWRYTKKLAIIEFMPLGLYDGHSAPPIPSWYTKHWFERHFSKFFIKEKEINLEKNRIAFIGSPRNDITI